MNLPITDILDQILASVPLLRPELALICGFIICILVSLFFGKRWKAAPFLICLATLTITFYLLTVPLSFSTTGFSGMWLVDRLGTLARMLIVFSSFIIALFFQERHKRNNGDIYSILLAATLGMNVLACTTNWLMAFIGIETISIASYILVGYFSSTKTQSEAAMKYALFGSVCAAVMLYGLSLIYGLTGDLDFQSPQHLQGLMAAPQAITTLALLFVFVGIGFKLSFVPFHVWSPDVYQGAPTAVTAFLSTVPKIAAIILFTRLYQAWSSTDFYFSDLTNWFIIIVAISTMLLGNLAALRQTDIKRMMAYSSIAHTGFLMMAVFAYQDSFNYLLFYIIAYVIMNLATFIFIDHVEQRTGSTTLADYSGLGKKMPVLFTSFTLVGISLIGLPPTIGFMGKLLVFSSVFDLYQETGDIGPLILLIVGALTSVISLFFYFRIPLYAFLRDNKKSYPQNSVSPTLTTIAVIFSFLIILLGLFPSILLQAL
ncbi:NADH-quinone oxidoreductase subunit N [Sphingobacterium sp. LRF_L2]|uniref:NADH-quinone oxidoreductase subunit N n=1 Tax=Sphingobacterium sp. LRF_L2 TaxID=3369421 RepID=UPI003F612982